MNPFFTIILFIEIALGLLLLQRELQQAPRFLTWLFFLSVTVVVLLAFGIDSTPTVTQNQNEILQKVQTGNIFQGITSTFLSFILLFGIIVIQRTEQQRFLVIYQAVIGGLLGWAVLHTFFKMISLPPYLIFSIKLAEFDIQILALYLLIVEIAYFIGLAATVGQQRTWQHGTFLITIVQYSLVFSILFTILLFHRPPDAMLNLCPYENIFALLLSAFYGFVFLVLFQKKWFWRLLVVLVLSIPLYFFLTP